MKDPIDEIREALEYPDFLERIDAIRGYDVAEKRLLDRLEAAESDGLEQARLNGMGSEREAALLSKLESAEKERDALRAKIERMERQEPTGKFIQHPSHGMWEQDGYGDNPDAKPLYALPGAQLAPNIPPRIEPNGMYDGNHHYASGWNDCREEMIAAAPKLEGE